MDFHRSLRQGAAEVIYGAGKTAEQIAGIAAAMGGAGVPEHPDHPVWTRRRRRSWPGAVPLDYHPVPRLGIAFPGERPALGHIVVATGGTSDQPAAEEAALTAEALGNKVTRLYDVGVAGLHRLLSNLEPLMSARCVVAVAGMEGGPGLGHRRAGGQHAI